MEPLPCYPGMSRLGMSNKFNSMPRSITRTSRAQTNKHALLLSQMKITQNHMTVSELSLMHKVLIIFSRHFGCVFQREMLLDICENYLDMLILDTIPIIIHQESNDQVEKHFEKNFSEHPIARRILRIHDKENLFAQFFGVNKGSPTPSTVTRKISLLIKGYPVFDQHDSATEGINSQRNPSMFLIHKNAIINQHICKDFYCRPDYLRIIVAPGADGQTTGPSNFGTFNRKNSEALGIVLVQNDRGNKKTTQKRSQKSINFIKKKISEHFSAFESVTGHLLRSDESLEEVCHVPPQRNRSKSSASNDRMSVSYVLEHEHRRRYFKLFLIKECCVENLLFFEAVMEYKSFSNDKPKRHLLANHILDAFFDEDSTLGINVSNMMREKVFRKLSAEGASLDLFTPVVSEVETMLTDSYSRFLCSSLFVEMEQNEESCAKEPIGSS
ncbi:regulator of G-protein signaling [Acrasis kona]|uniref:Regulator of G-protein signaling n=1 Tax=Acrasis kona TaxID=1008807 RepID=A0AAW2ZN92_9EUKA